MIDVNAAALDRAVSELASGEVTPYVLDVADSAASFALSDRIAAELGPVFGLVTSAGVTAGAPSAEMNPERWRRVIDVNLSGTFFSAQAFARQMIARGSGSIVMISSASGLGGQAGHLWDKSRV